MLDEMAAEARKISSGGVLLGGSDVEETLVGLTRSHVAPLPACLPLACQPAS